MSPSSLIFFVIITVWAVYVIQHWIRRRDHVATARSVDRFSAAMRVLERRRVVPQMSVSAPQRPSYAVGLARPAHPDVVVKRAQPRLTLVGSEPAADRTSGPEPTRPVPAGPAQTRPTAAASTPEQRPAGRRTKSSASRPRRTVTAKAPLFSPARVRALVLLVGTALLVAGAVLATTTWWAAPAGIAAFAVSLGYARASVARARRRAASPVRHPSARPQVGARPEKARTAKSRTTQRRPARRTSGQAPLTAAPVAAARVRGSAPIYVAPDASPDHVRPTVAAGLYDVEAVEAARTPAPAAAETPVETRAEAAPGTWQPVPVPPPTYTLKARAPRPSERVAADTPVEDLPFDGNALALDEEFEDLPPVHQVV